MNVKMTKYFSRSKTRYGNFFCFTAWCCFRTICMFLRQRQKAFFPFEKFELSRSGTHAGLKRSLVSLLILVSMSRKHVYIVRIPCLPQYFLLISLVTGCLGTRSVQVLTMSSSVHLWSRAICLPDGPLKSHGSFGQAPNINVAWVVLLPTERSEFRILRPWDNTLPVQSWAGKISNAEFCPGSRCLSCMQATNLCQSGLA